MHGLLALPGWLQRPGMPPGLPLRSAGWAAAHALVAPEAMGTCHAQRTHCGGNIEYNWSGHPILRICLVFAAHCEVMVTCHIGASLLAGACPSWHSRASGCCDLSVHHQEEPSWPHTDLVHGSHLPVARPVTSVSMKTDVKGTDSSTSPGTASSWAMRPLPMCSRVCTAIFGCSACIKCFSACPAACGELRGCRSQRIHGGIAPGVAFRSFTSHCITSDLLLAASAAGFPASLHVQPLCWP